MMLSYGFIVVSMIRSICMVAQRIDFAKSFRDQSNLNPCSQLLNLALNVNERRFDELTTLQQTIILLTKLPATISAKYASHVTRRSLVIVRAKISHFAYICEIGDGIKDICKKMMSFITEWKIDPIKTINAEKGITNSILSISKPEEVKTKDSFNEEAEYLLKQFSAPYLEQLNSSMLYHCRQYSA